MPLMICFRTKNYSKILTAKELWAHIHGRRDKAREDVVKAVKTFCKTRIDDTTSEYTDELLSVLMTVYDAEAQKGIEDKEISSILFKARFSKDSKTMQKRMERIRSDKKLTSRNLVKLCQPSYGLNRLLLGKKLVKDK